MIDMKWVILAAWYGTRMLPITKSIPKELMPVGNKPVLQYTVESLVDFGIEDIVMVTAQWKQAIEDYFDKNYELEEVLKKKNKLEFLEEVCKPKELANISFVKQKSIRGNADALMEAAPWVDTDYFIMVWWDHIRHPKIFEEAFTLFRRHKKPVASLTRVPWDKVHKYGIVEMEWDKIINLIEKPKQEEAPSNLMLNGVYIFPKTIFDYIQQIEVDERLWEHLLTDAVLQLIENEWLLWSITPHRVRDIWTPWLWHKANKDYFENDGNIFAD